MQLRSFCVQGPSLAGSEDPSGHMAIPVFLSGKTAGIADPGLPRTSNATQARPDLFQPEEDHSLHGPDGRLASKPTRRHMVRLAGVTPPRVSDDGREECSMGKREWEEEL